MRRVPQPFVVLVRVVNALFFLATTIYAILTYSPFAYEQFIQPNMIAWLSNFVFLHTDFYWLTLCLTLLTLAPHLQSGRGRLAAWFYLAAGGAAGLALTFTTALPAGNMPVRSVVVALAALVPIVWLGVIDRLTAPVRPRRVPPAEGSSLIASLAAAGFVWAVFAAQAPARLRAVSGLDVSASTRQLAEGMAASLAAHLAAFTLGSLALAAARAAGVPIAAIASAALGFVLHEVVLAPISIGGVVSWTLAFAMAIAIVMLSSGILRQFAPARSPTVPLLCALVAVPLAAFFAVPILTTFDWGFMLQKLVALTAAFVAFAVADRTAARANPKPVPIVGGVMLAYASIVVALPRLPAVFADVRLRPEFALDAYATADPSYRVLRQFLDTSQTQPDDAAFYAYLRANSSIKEHIDPVDVRFASLDRPASQKPPDIFFFIIDSLRRDYVSAYNPRVAFTPRLGAFARDSDVFTRAFSRYGGTGLAVPSIWAGALMAHKQYVTPFAPMNALAKVLDAGGYRRIVTRDHITDELFGLDRNTDVLDVGVLEMMHTFCGTMEELKAGLKQSADDRRPLFAHTRPLDLHIGNTRFASVPVGESYPGFFEPYAARVKRIDACFGDFVDELKRANRYDESLIVVMADHGDSLGEGLRWGHGYTIVPEVLRIPLIVHVPVSMRSRFTTDVSQLALGTDVTPSIYSLLGHETLRSRNELGVSLYHPGGTPGESRRREDFLVASSYGAVYGLLSHNGRRLYIADGIEGRDSMYDLSAAGGDARVGMTDAERVASRAAIRQHLAHLADWYKYGPLPAR